MIIQRPMGTEVTLTGRVGQLGSIVSSHIPSYLSGTLKKILLGFMKELPLEEREKHKKALLQKAVQGVSEKKNRRG